MDIDGKALLSLIRGQPLGMTLQSLTVPEAPWCSSWMQDEASAGRCPCALACALAGMCMHTRLRAYAIASARDALALDTLRGRA